MLTTIFSYNGAEYKSNRIPESYDNLCRAASQIRWNSSTQVFDDSEVVKFKFSYVVGGSPSGSVPKAISSDEQLI